MHVFAYIDPGAGALVWQSIIAAFVGVMFYLKRTRKVIGAFFKKAFGNGQNDKPAEPSPEILQRTSDKDNG
jgi:hypothetical protein